MSSKQRGKNSESLARVISRVGVDDSWDFLLVGDGSGSGWDIGCGWGVVLIERDTMKRHLFYGAMHPGTVMLGEIMPYLQALTWLQAELEKRRKRGSVLRRVHNIHILTDSMANKVIGSRTDKQVSKKNRGFWAIMTMLERQGLRIKWHHVKRESVALNRVADKLSKLSRRSLLRVETYADSVNRQETINP